MTLRINRQFSYQFATLLLSVHCVIAYAIILLSINVEYRLLALSLLLLNCYSQWRRQLHFRSKSAVHGFEYLGDAQWRLHCSDGSFRTRLANPPVVTAWLVVLEFAVTDNDRRLVLLFNDSAAAESLRRLRVLLRLTPQLQTTQ